MKWARVEKCVTDKQQLLHYQKKRESKTTVCRSQFLNFVLSKRITDSKATAEWILSLKKEKEEPFAASVSVVCQFSNTYTVDLDKELREVPSLLG